MSPFYENPPLREAVCEFRFLPDSPWDMAIPGLIYSKLRDDFPTRLPSQGIDISARIEVGPEGRRQQVQSTEELRFWRDDNSGAIVIRPHLLSVSHFRPYTSWEGFLSVIKVALQAYLEVAKPTGFERIGLRYFNDFTFEAGVRLEDFFDFYPFLGKDMLQEYITFRVGVEYVFDDKDVLRVQLGSNKSEDPGTVGTLLDLDYFSIKPGTIPLQHASAWIEQAYTRIEQAFEGSLTDPLRQRLEEVKE